MANNNYERLKKMNPKEIAKAYLKMLVDNKRRIIIGAVVILIISMLIGGLFAQILGAKNGLPSFIDCFKYAVINSTGRFITIFSFVLLSVVTVIFLMKNLTDQESDPIKNIVYSDRGTYGTSRYLKPFEYAEFLDVVDSACETNGFIFGTTEDGKIVAMKMDAEVTNRNVFGTGSQGTGKSRGLIRCMIMQSAIRGASMVIMDTKSELTSDCAAYLKRKGYHVVIWNLINLENSNGWDILGEFGDERKIPTIVNTIIVNSGDGKGGDFFDNIESILLESLCRYVYEVNEPGRRNIGEAYNILLTKSPDEIDAMFETLRAQDPMSEAAKRYILFSGSGSNKGNAILGLGSRLRIFGEETVRRITGKADINLEDIAREKTALFLVMSASDQTYNMLGATITTLLFDSIFRYAQTTPYQRCDVPVEFILDEFPNVGYINGFAQKLGVARSYDIGIHIMIQNIPQFYDRYEQNKATEIMGGCNYNLYLGCNEPETSKYYSVLMGNATQKVRTEKDSGGIIGATINGGGGSQGDGQRPVEYEDELRRYAKDELYLQINTKKPIKLKKFDYSRHPEALLMRKVVATELIPEWRIVNNKDIVTSEVVDKDKVITTDEWLELVGSDSDKIPPITINGKDGKVKEISRLCVEDTEQYGPSRSNLIKEAKEMKRKYASEGKTPNGQPFLADNPIAMVNPNKGKASKYKGSLTRENSGSVRVVNGMIVDVGKEAVAPQKYDDEYVASNQEVPESQNTSQNYDTPQNLEAVEPEAKDVLADPLADEIKKELQTTKVEDIKPNPVKAEKEDIKPISNELKESILPTLDFEPKPKKKKKRKKNKPKEPQKEVVKI